MSDDYKFQISDKAGDAIIVVRGADMDEFAGNLLAYAADVELPDLVANFSKAVKASAGQLAQAVATVQRQAGGQVVNRYEEAPAGSADQQWCNTHGQPRTRREGISKKTNRKYAGWYCPATGCTPVWEGTRG